MLEYIINLPCYSNWISFQIIYLYTPIHCIYLLISLVLLYIGKQQPELFQSNGEAAEQVKKKVYSQNCLILARTFNSILWKYSGVPLFLDEQKIWSWEISSFLHGCDSLIDLQWFHFKIVSFQQKELSQQWHSFQSSLMHEIYIED